MYGPNSSRRLSKNPDPARGIKYIDHSKYLGAIEMGSTNGRPETGKVTWLRNLNEAKILSRSSNLPIFLLFQEIPGCSTCTEFGKNVLSPKEMVEKIAKEFVPCIINNRGGTPHDISILRSYNEPYLNNPVVRFLDCEGNDVIPRVSGEYTAVKILQRMQECQAAFKQPEHNTDESMKIYFEVGCYWVGEGIIDSIGTEYIGQGLRATESVWIWTSEAVKVEYVPGVFNLLEFVQRVWETGKFSAIRCPHKTQLRELQSLEAKVSSVKSIGLRAASKKDQKYYLTRSRKSIDDIGEIERIKLNGGIWNSRFSK